MDFSLRRPGLIVYSHSEMNKKLNVKRRRIPWWQSEIIYQVYPRSFCDSNGDGVGDLKGITSKADYLKDLGVGAVWLSPVYPSPMADFGYDIADFVGIEPLFGTMADFEELRAALHDRGLKLMMDFVPNHSSDEHEWFVKSKRKEEPYTDYYIWADPKGFSATGQPIPPNNWLSVFRGSAWTWVEERQQFYYHQFLAKQPDLNYRNERVREEMKNVLRFWLDKGVDGFRVDAITHLFEVEDLSQDEPFAADSGTDDPLDYGYLNHTLTLNQPETFTVVKEWRDVLDQYPDKAMIIEVFGEEIDEVMKYYGNDTVPLADFPFNFLLIEHLRSRGDLTGFALKDTIDLWMDNMPEGKWPNWVLGNHDNGRVGSRFGADAVDALNMLSLLLPGTPVTYNGEEIGMVNTFISWEDTQDPQGCRYGPEHYQEYSRDPERTPMQWDNSSFAGFTKGNSTWLPVNENYKELNVKAQLQAEETHLKIYKELARLRKEETFVRGHVAYPVVTFEIFSVMRYLEGYESYLLVINTSEQEVEVDLHHNSNMELPPSAVVVLRSITDTANATVPGSVVKLSEMILVPGEGLLLNLIEED
ncbi:maltase A3-like isoform X2 [Penaeus japonicus]|uniref:maltase A3-like isoform X2 n=1 Tax=Penaeus japonicus TaxID=27405 RepID=UPI001C717261|nr:maltase A3-like isoform X2 [Penaeus japonicus]